jgi:hypothetical protein
MPPVAASGRQSRPLSERQLAAPRCRAEAGQQQPTASLPSVPERWVRCIWPVACDRAGVTAHSPLYESIGARTRTRLEDPRFAAEIRSCLGGSRSVVNVGAGTGNYEPSDRLVVAVEPSPAMRRVPVRRAGARPRTRRGPRAHLAATHPQRLVRVVERIAARHHHRRRRPLARLRAARRPARAYRRSQQWDGSAPSMSRWSPATSVGVPVTGEGSGAISTCPAQTGDEPYEKPGGRGHSWGRDGRTPASSQNGNHDSPAASRDAWPAPRDATPTLGV